MQEAIARQLLVQILSEHPNVTRVDGDPSSEWIGIDYVDPNTGDRHRIETCGHILYAGINDDELEDLAS